MTKKLFVLFLAVFMMFGVLSVPVAAAVKIDGTVQLNAGDAELEGDQIRFEGDLPTIGYWEKDNTAYWNIEVAVAGTYKVIINYCKSTNNPADVKVTVGDKSVMKEIEPNGSWVDYIDFELGNIELASEDNKLTIGEGDNFPDQYLMNLSSITLELVKAAPAPVAETVPVPETPAAPETPDNSAGEVSGGESPVLPQAPATGDGLWISILVCVIFSAAILFVHKKRTVKN